MLTTKLRTLTPADCRAILEASKQAYIDTKTVNRPIRETKVAQYAAQMVAGSWSTTHQGIAICADGRVPDGQHRLNAAILSNRPLTVLVTTGVDWEDFRNIDGGIPRKVSDRIHLVDDANINRLCCAIVTAYVKNGLSTHQMTVDDVENAFLGMADAFVYVASAFTSKVKLVTLASVGAAMACYHNSHQMQAVEAMEHLLTGRMLDEKHPILVLRNALLAQRLRGECEQYWKTIWALRAYHEKKDVVSIMTASADFAGNVYSKLQWERKAIGLKAGFTRKVEAIKKKAAK